MAMVIGLLELGLSVLSFNFLSQLFLVVRSANVLCEYATLIRLKFSDPDKPRPFKIPGGKIGSILLVLPTISICIFFFSSTDFDALFSGLLCAIRLLKKLWNFI